MIDFKNLTKTKVHIGIGGGSWIEVDMLPVCEYERVCRILKDAQAKVGSADAVDAVIETRKTLCGMALKVMPPELHDSVMRMDMEDLTALVFALCTGKDDSDKDAPEKKVVLQSQL